MKKLFLIAALAFFFINAPQTLAKPGRAELAGYNVMISAQKSITRVTASDLPYVKTEAACAKPYLDAAKGKSGGDYYAAFDVSYGSVLARAAQNHPEVVRNVLASLYQGSISNPRPLLRRALAAQARAIEGLMILPSSSTCGILEEWQSAGFVGLNEIVDNEYGDMVFQNAWNIYYKNDLWMGYVMKPRLQKILGKKRAEAFTRGAFWKALATWREVAGWYY